jgi:hypothetical protein
LRSEAPPQISLRPDFPRLDQSDRLEEVAAAGILMELPTFDGDDLLRGARLLAAKVMLRRSGFDLILLPPVPPS